MPIQALNVTVSMTGLQYAVGPYPPSYTAWDSETPYYCSKQSDTHYTYTGEDGNTLEIIKIDGVWKIRFNDDEGNTVFTLYEGTGTPQGTYGAIGEGEAYIQWETIE